MPENDSNVSFKIAGVEFSGPVWLGVVVLICLAVWVTASNWPPITSPNPPIAPKANIETTSNNDWNNLFKQPLKGE